MQAVAAQRHARGKLAYHAGQAAEQQVAQVYLRRGFAVVAQRWRGRAGEIDLILRDDCGLLFVEVKQARDFDRAAHSLSQRQIARLYGAAEEFLAGEPTGALTELRFDVALVNGQGQMQIIENAFA